MTTETAALPAQAEAFDPRKAIARIAHAIRREDFGTGSLATLRRTDPSSLLGQPAFHRLVTDFPDDQLITPKRWATIVHAMAIGSRLGEEVPKASAGAAFAHAGLSEARFSKLMAARGQAFRDQVAMVARRLSAKSIGFGWGDLGELVLVEDWNESRAEVLRFRIARDYYRALDHHDHKKTA